MRAGLVRATAVAVALLTIAACSDAPTEPQPLTASETEPSLGRSGAKLKDWLRSLRNHPRATSLPILVGAGDIAECYQGSTPPPLNPTVDVRGSAAWQTARLLDRIPGTVITIGDNAYQFGSPIDYATCYEPTWGRHKSRTEPSAGNHEYMSGGSGYFAYFGLRARPPLGYYSYNVGSWHVVVLNSTPQVYLCRPPETTENWPPTGTPEAPVVLPEPPDMTTTEGRLCAGDVAQQAWLVADLTAHRQYECTIVYFHHPRFSSGAHGNHAQMQRIWDIMWLFGVDLVLTGHDHNYERFAPQDRDGNRDLVFGIRQFVVGTGGADLRSVGPPIANSEVIRAGVYGVIALALGNGRYGWAFIDIDRSVRDSGTGSCHAAPPA